MVAAEPVKGVAYRKSQRSQQAYEQANKKQEQQETVAGGSPAPATGAGNSRTGSATVAASSNPSTRRSGTTPDLTNTPTRATASGSTAEPAAKRARRAARAAAEASPETRSTGPSHDARTSAVSPSPADGTPVPETQEMAGFTLESTREIRAPVGTFIDAEAQIAQSKADVLRLKAEAEARAAAGETPAEMGLVASSSTRSSTLIDAASPEGSRGTKRTAARQAEDEATEITGSAVVLPGTVAEVVVRRHHARVVQPEEARRRGAVMGALMFGVGAAGAWAVQNLL